MFTMNPITGDRRRIEMAYALQFSLPGTPVVRYGDEIGMGEDLSLPERNAIRTPMQWSSDANAGFSTAKRKRDLRRPVITGGDFGFETVNVANQQQDPTSLLSWFQRALLILRECPEFGSGRCAYVDTGDRSVLALVRDAPSGTMLALTNLSPKARTVSLGAQPEQNGPPVSVFADRDYPEPGQDLDDLALAPYGYRWIRLRRTIGARAGSTSQH
jgi:maltose alpha-D-glucosyltransferase/alpha-amylase